MMPLAICGAFGNVFGFIGLMLLLLPGAMPGRGGMGLPWAARRLAARFCAEVASDRTVVQEQDAVDLRLIIPRIGRHDMDEMIVIAVEETVWCSCLLEVCDIQAHRRQSVTLRF